jgi:hypothetical protein
MDGDYQSCISSFILENKSLKSLIFDDNELFYDFNILNEIFYHHKLVELYPTSKSIEIILERNRRIEKIKGSKIQTTHIFDIKFFW